MFLRDVLSRLPLGIRTRGIAVATLALSFALALSIFPAAFAFVLGIGIAVRGLALLRVLGFGALRRLGIKTGGYRGVTSCFGPLVRVAVVSAAILARLRSVEITRSMSWHSQE